MSNSVLTINAFVTTGMTGTLVCLVLLVGVHKLEYILNSRIIGGIVNLPMAVSLGALIFCEVLLGIPGLILAIPLVLFVRHEFEHIRGLPPNLPEEVEQVPKLAGGALSGATVEGRVSEEPEATGRLASKTR